MSRREQAHVWPFLLFIGLLALVELLARIFEGEGPFWTSHPEHWVYPLQTILCAAVLWWFWDMYEFNGLQRPILTIALAVLVLAIWISPQEFFGQPRRYDGFDPTLFAGRPTRYALVLGLRFLRLVVVVPLLEEIFWRGFLLRYLIDERTERVPFGAFSWFSFAAVTGCFGLAHYGPDLVPALITGALYNLVAYRTRSLGSCILAHAATNLLLGLYIVRTGQWGFW
jgi:uncharacterized protein